MKHLRLYRTCFFIIFPLFLSCQSGGGKEAGGNGNDDPPEVSAEFKDYWYQGEAEIARFELEQARYGEMRKGDVVMVFVTEPFLTETQVKREKTTNEPSTSVLKLNFVRDFTTGIYDYNMMTSTFLPVDREQYPHALKVTTSSQEWCGHSYVQLNYREGNYQLQEHSYFQDVADDSYPVDKAHLEDEIWNLIRMGPHRLPLGLIEMIPGTQFSRLRHFELAPKKAEASLDPYQGERFPGEDLSVYSVKYQNIDRALRIVLEKDFPYRIAGFEVLHQSGFGDGAEQMTTRGVRTHLIKSAYWKKNGTGDIDLRKKLGLDAQ